VSVKEVEQAASTHS